MTAAPRRRIAGLLSPSVFCSLLVLAATGGSLADDGFWATAGGGSWASPGNWDEGVIAEGADNTAYFGVTAFANIPADATFTLDGPRTIGHLFFTDIDGPDHWQLNPGTGGLLTLSAAFDTPSIAVSRSDQQITFNVVLAGTNGLEKLLNGTLVLNETNAYSGTTTIRAGTLRVNGRIGPDAVVVAGGTLGGTGTITGPVTVQPGGTLAPGESIGPLNLGNALVLQPGSTTLVEVNAATSGHDLVQGVTSVSYGGTLVVSNLAGTPVLGQSFQLFSAASASGNFASLTPPLAGGLRWKFEPLSGTLSVVSSASQPVITHVAIVGGNVVFLVTNGLPGGTSHLMGSTNLALPMADWTRLATNKFDVSGNCFFTNAASLAAPPQFYRISATAVP
jgi:autotransporter-associated beta strand protein